MSGVYFDGIHSADIGVFVRSVDRSLLPGKRVTQYIIPGKSGSYDVENGYENRTIVCEFGFVGDNLTRFDFRIKARKVAQWLSGKGTLIFDDEPDKCYQAQVVDSTSIEEVAATGKAQVSFLCSPFAESLDYSLVHTENAPLPKQMNVTVNGTQESNPTIFIKASSAITGIKITRRTTY